MKVAELFKSNPFNGVVAGQPMKIRNLYSPSDLDDALKTKPSKQTITIKNNSTGEILGKRTIYQN
jgi:hypothetical protein